MNWQGWIRSKPGLGVAAVVLCLVAATVIARRGSGGRDGERYWYFDLETHELVAHNLIDNNVSPIRLSNGHDAVMAYKFACGSCAASDPFPGYLYKVTDKYVTAMEAGPETRDPDSPIPGQLIAKVPSDHGQVQWVEQYSDEGATIMQNIAHRCGTSTKPVMCLP